LGQLGARLVGQGAGWVLRPGGLVLGLLDAEWGPVVQPWQWIDRKCVFPCCKTDKHTVLSNTHAHNAQRIIWALNYITYLQVDAMRFHAWLNGCQRDVAKNTVTTKRI
jgi:hypothetical protein